MKGGAKRLYDLSPIWLQNLLVSAYGLRRQWQRHGGDYAKHLAFYLHSQWWTESQFQDFQLARLRELVAFAMAYVPYFREEYGKQGVRSEYLESIKGLPILEKEVFRTQLDRCVAECWSRNQLFRFHTSGSTGTPLTYFIHPHDFRERMALMHRQWRWAGVKEGDRSATLTGNLIVPGNPAKPPFWRHNWAGHQLLLSSYHMADSNLPSYAAKLHEFQPEVIEGYPSAIYMLARWLESHGQEGLIKPRAVIVTAENLHSWQRIVIERVFGAKVYNYYSSSEGAPFITECEAGSLHLNPDAGLFEFLRPDGSDAEAGEEAQLVVTAFCSRAMPLLRYRIRDLAVREAPGVCSCGRYMPRVRALTGRLDDMVYTRDRGWVGRLGHAIKAFPQSIREAQIVQETIDSIVVKIVPDPARFDSAHLGLLYQDLRSRLGDTVEIRVCQVDEIPKSARGKFRYVVCQLPVPDRHPIEPPGIGADI